MDVGGVCGENLASDAGGVEASDIDLHVVTLLEVEVRERHKDRSVFSPRRSPAQGGEGLLAEFDLAGIEVHRNRDRVLVAFVEIEGMIGRRQEHLLAFGEDHRLQDVDGLGDVGHPHAVGVAMENVKRQRGHEGIAHRVLLVEEARIRARLAFVPRAPLVDDHGYALFRIVEVHDRRVLGDALVYRQGAFQAGEILLVAEING